VPYSSRVRAQVRRLLDGIEIERAARDLDAETLMVDPITGVLVVVVKTAEPRSPVFQVQRFPVAAPRGGVARSSTYAALRASSARMSRPRASLLVLSLVLACGSDDAEGEASDASSAPSSSLADPTASATDGADTALDASDTGDPTTDASADDGSGDASVTDATDATGDAPQGGGVIDVTLGGCVVDLGGTVVVSYNGSLGVASVYDDGATLTGSFQFDQLSVGAFELSSQQRVDTGLVINLTDVGSTWTNLDGDALVTGRDTISGTLTVETWSPARGIATLQLDAVTLRNVVDGGLCTVDGTIETTQLYP
jgi:hypothetical protein